MEVTNLQFQLNTIKYWYIRRRSMMYKIFSRFCIINVITIINLFHFILINGCSDYVTKLIADLEDENQDVRMRAAESLGEVKDSRAVEPLISALSDVELTVQTKAAEALVNIGASAFKPLIASLNKKNLYIRYQAKFILNQIDPNWHESIAAKMAILDFISALKDADSSVLAASAEALDQIDPSWRDSAGAINAVPELVTALQANDSDVQKRAENALAEIGNSKLKLLIANLKEDQRSIRKNAILELSEKSFELEWLKDTLAIEILIASLKDSDSDVRRSAVLVLGKIRNSIAAVGLIEALKDTSLELRNSAKTALKNMGEPAVPSLVRILNNANLELRKTAAWIIGETGGELALRSLLAELRKNNLPVVTGAYIFYLRLGESGSEPILVEALNNYGNYLIAIDFLNCGNGQLAKAAENWARNNGFKLYAYKVNNPEDIQVPKWGSIRR